MYSIAIDGPAGAGKSTIAKTIAKKLEFIYVDTGAMYRAMALYFIRHEIDPKDEEAINKACPDIHVSINYEDGVQQVLLNGENVNGLIRTEEVSMMTSNTSKYPVVREKLLSLQRGLAEKENVIMEHGEFFIQDIRYVDVNGNVSGSTFNKYQTADPYGVAASEDGKRSYM